MRLVIAMLFFSLMTFGQQKESSYNPVSFLEGYNLNPQDLNSYLAVFYFDFYKNSEQFKGENWLDIVFNIMQYNNTNIYFQEIANEDIKEESNVLALALGMFDDCKVQIQVNPLTWYKVDHVRRLWIIYHELAHDVFNIEHHEGGPLMNPVIPGFIDETDFLNAKDLLIQYVSDNSLYPFCNADYNDLNDLLSD